MINIVFYSFEETDLFVTLVIVLSVLSSMCTSAFELVVLLRSYSQTIEIGSVIANKDQYIILYIFLTLTLTVDSWPVLLLAFPGCQWSLKVLVL